MPSGFHQHSSDIEAIVGVQFGIFSPEEIERRSVVEITTQATYEGSEPKIGGLFDPRMGVLDNGKQCRSCGQTNHGCPGHFAHYRLTKPVYYIQFFETVLKILRCVCIRCAKLLIDKQQAGALVGRKKGEVRWKEVSKLCSSISRCGQDNEDGCGAIQPQSYKREGIARVMANFGPLLAEGSQILEVDYVLQLFRRITDEDVNFMGFNHRFCRPDWMICTVLAIPPPQVRPSVVQDNNQRSEDDLTHKLFEIIKADKTLAQKIENNASKYVIDELTNVLQYHVATLVDNQIPGVAPSAQRSGRPLKSIQQRLGSKEGRIRYNIQGKRVEFSARSVITPDPNISISELGVPLKIAMNLTVPERVTAFNRDKLYKFVQNGADTYPGAKTIVRADGRMISLRHINTRELVLYAGDVVHRHLMDGDIVLFNRQPTLHRMSMMGHKAKVLPYNTFRLNVSVCSAYNADFDGDEMNAHIPQSYESAVELEEITAVPHQIITPRDPRPIISVVQDTLVGAYRLTRPNNQFNVREYMNLMMYNKRFDGTIPKAREGTDQAPRWTGHQVVSRLLPPLNLEMANGLHDANPGPQNFVKIREGDVLQGTFDKGIFSKSSKGIIHTTYNDYGPKATVDLIDSFQNTIESYLILNGFSVGISDLVADEETNQRMQESIEKRKKEVEEILLQVHLDLFDNNTGKTNQEELETKVFSALNKATDDSGKIGQESLADENRMTAMVRAGSKGGVTNIAQMMACVGQQSVEGKRIPYGYMDRSLPHYKKYDDGAEARGFVESSFLRGLTPQEFFFHAMSGREGLIDTAVKTADTGYIQRQLVKAMEDIVVQHDGSVRDANMNIIQYHYGEDGVNATKLEGQNLPLGKLTELDIRKQFGLQDIDFSTVMQPGVEREEDADDLLRYVEEVLEDRKMLVEGVFGSGRQGGVHSPVNIERLINNIKIRFGLDIKAGLTDLTPYYVLQGIDKLLTKTQKYNRIWAALLRFQLAPHILIVKERFTKKAFDILIEMLLMKNWQAWAHPGEFVGILAAQSIGEPSTQMTLNTFHLAGVASKSNVTRGVPRLKELLKVTQNPKATSLTIYLKPEYRESKEKARELSQDLEMTLLRDIVLKAAIYYDPSNLNSVVEEDRELIEFYQTLENGAARDENYTPFSKYVLRIEFDREKMFNKNITMNDVAFILKNKTTDIEMIYSDYNSKKLVMRIRIMSKPVAGQLDYIDVIKRFQNNLLNTTVVRGVSGIKAVTFRQDSTFLVNEDGEYKTVQQYILDTDGSNFMEVMNHPAVDGNRLCSTNVHDVYGQLGVEAARATLLNEITNLFEEVGINSRHLGLLCDVMTRGGRLMSADRYGINKNDIGPIAKASFEETERILLKAALYGEVDPVTGVSANIMMGQPIRGGTAFSQIMLDEQVLPGLLADLKPMDTIEEEEETQELDEQFADSLGDECERTATALSAAVPTRKTNMIDEEDVELEII
jgi:DNA-directed RNA polymerase II subunit RPB1